MYNVRAEGDPLGGDSRETAIRTIPQIPHFARLGQSWVGLGLVLSVGLSGCVRVYHPLNGLHDPIVVNPQLPNFADVALTVRCVPGDYLSSEDNGILCQNVGQLFETQGASVRVVEVLGEDESFRDDELEGGDGETAETAEPPTDLVLELTSRRVSRRVSTLSWLLCVGSFTVLPGVEEHIFEQDITIRDANGFLLVQDSLQGRLLSRFGFGPWLVSKLADLGRDKDDRLTAKNVRQDVSNDLYRQLSQRLFDAKLQWRVLQESNASLGESR